MSIPYLDRFLLAVGNAASGGPITAQAGVLKTAAAAGQTEFDAALLQYYVTGQSQRGQIGSVQRMVQTADRAFFANNTSAQTAFDVVTNGAFNAKAGKAYRFRAGLSLAGLSSTSGNVSFGFGGTATVTKIRYQTMGIKATAGAANTSAANSNHVDAAALSVNGATASTTGTAAAITVEEGYVVINAAGTLIPQIALGVAVNNSAKLSRGSFFEIWEVPDGVVGDFS